jgi:hypothetical protein
MMPLDTRWAEGKLLVVKKAGKLWLLTKEPKTDIGEKMASSTNGAEKTAYPHVEDWN